MSALDGLAAMYADQHRAEGMGCSCGFGIWSVEHVVIMTVREMERRGDFVAKERVA